MENPVIQIIVVASATLYLGLQIFNKIKELNVKKRITVLALVLIFSIVFFIIKSFKGCGNDESIIGTWCLEDEGYICMRFYKDGKIDDNENRHIESNNIKYNRFSIKEQNGRKELILYSLDDIHDDPVINITIKEDTLYFENTQKYIRR